MQWSKVQARTSPTIQHHRGKMPASIEAERTEVTMLWGKTSPTRMVPKQAADRIFRQVRGRRVESNDITREVSRAEKIVNWGSLNVVAPSAATRKCCLATLAPTSNSAWKTNSNAPATFATDFGSKIISRSARWMFRRFGWRVWCEIEFPKYWACRNWITWSRERFSSSKSPRVLRIYPNQLTCLHWPRGRGTYLAVAAVHADTTTASRGENLRDIGSDDQLVNERVQHSAVASTYSGRRLLHHKREH